MVNKLFIFIRGKLGPLICITPYTYVIKILVSQISSKIFDFLFCTGGQEFLSGLRIHLWCLFLGILFEGRKENLLHLVLDSIVARIDLSNKIEPLLLLFSSNSAGANLLVEVS